MVRMRFDSVKVAPAVDVEKGSASESARGTKQERVESKGEREKARAGGARASACEQQSDRGSGQERKHARESERALTELRACGKRRGISLHMHEIRFDMELHKHECDSS